MINQTVVHIFCGVLVSNTKEQTIDKCNNLDACPRDCAKRKEPGSRRTGFSSCSTRAQ